MEFIDENITGERIITHEMSTGKLETRTACQFNHKIASETEYFPLKYLFSSLSLNKAKMEGG